MHSGTLHCAVTGQQHRQVLVGQHQRQTAHEQRAVVGQAVILALVHLVPLRMPGWCHQLVTVAVACTSGTG